MLSFIIRILTFIAALWIVRWVAQLFFGRGRQASPAGRERKSPGPAQSMVKDPVCGMYMDPRLALRLDRGEGGPFFCSEGCREKYRARPE